jgi:hypothetical protein
MKNNKELARECFDHYLKEGLHLRATWTTGEQPPDYYLEVGAHRLAVQVAVLQGWLATEGRPFWELQHERAGGVRDEEERAERIASAAAQRGMRGSYGISFVMALGAFNDRIKQEVEDQALQYIEDTQEPGKPLPHSICVGNVVCRIGKCAGRVDSVEVVRLAPLDYAKWGERVGQARTAVERALSDAQRALAERPPAGSSLPAVLLLLNKWLHGTKGIYGPRIRASALRECWHSIFVVEGSTEGYFPLEEHERKWKLLAEPDQR